MKCIVCITTLLISSLVWAQTQTDSIMLDPQKQLNAAQRILSGNYGSTVTIGAYGEMQYLQPENDNGTLDVHRLVLLLGYRFDEKVQFVTEIEIEHVEEVYVEQAFINYNVAHNVNLRGGLMLVPMGIVNEYHEPTTFNGVERPAVDHDIVPSTWRELGVGVSGRFDNVSLGYQAYVFNGFKSAEIDAEGEILGFLKGADGLRGGRQKGIESTVNTPTFSAKLEYYGLPGLRMGLATYFGKSQASHELNETTGATVGISMIGLDARYALQRFTARGQLIYTTLSGTESYNLLTGRDLGSVLKGWYLETAYNLLPQHFGQRLYGFVRFEKYDTHAATAGALARNQAYDRTDVTTGLSYHIAPGVVLKGDYQFKSNALEGADIRNQLNFGIGVWF
ncbi:MAG: hypothetical protein MUO53_12490 [Maribacter sp.]|nr:hypothetical protein [Maribacter sp.]